MTDTITVRTLILGAGAAGMFCAANAGADVLIVDHAKAPGEKIRISGGGRCNFTNLDCGPHAFLSQNPHFAKSALHRYGAADFLALIEAHGIAWHEKTLGQLFCDGRATQIVDMLRGMMAENNADLWLETQVIDVVRGSTWRVTLRRAGRDTTVHAANLVLATGGRSIPKMGATGLAYRLAEQFGLRLVPPRAALVPFTFAEGRFADLAGVAVPVRATAAQTSFDEAMLFTHRGLSGPAILQASSYWHEGADLTVDLAPGADLAEMLKRAKVTEGRRALRTHLAGHLPGRLVAWLEQHGALTVDTAPIDMAKPLAEVPDRVLDGLAAQLGAWQLRPDGTEGYRTAEVTLGGVDTAGLSSKTMAARSVPGLYVIGEAVDVTGWLGGYNFQWAWSSGHAAGTAIAGP